MKKEKKEKEEEEEEEEEEVEEWESQMRRQALGFVMARRAQQSGLGRPWPTQI